MTEIINAILIGDTAVGKSTIFTRLSTSNFVQSIDSTIGAILIRYTNDDYNININLWDTAGQERFFSLVPSYIRKGHVIIIVLDCKKNIEIQIMKYLKLLQTSELNTELKDILLVINKCDLINEIEIDNVKIECNYNVDKFLRKYMEVLDGYETELLNILRKIKIIAISAKSGYGFDFLNKILSSYKSIQKDSKNLDDVISSYENYFRHFKIEKKCYC